MNWILYFGLVVVGIGIGAALVYLAQSRNLPGPGQHTGPMLLADEKPSHPRFGELLDTPGDGFQVERPDGMIRVGAHERNVRPRRTADHAPWSASLPVLDEQAEAEQARVDFARAQLEQYRPAQITPELLRQVMGSLRAMPVHGEKPVATVLAAQAEAEAAA